MKPPFLPTSQCPVCRYEMDSASDADGRGGEPSAGDLSVCLNCGEMLQFNDIRVLKSITRESIEELDAETKTVLFRVSEKIKARGRFK